MPNPLATIYRKGSEPSDVDYWLIWPTVVEVNRSPVIEDMHDRIYWSGSELPYPKYKPWSEIQDEWAASDGNGNTAYCEGAAWRLGVPAPAAALEVSGGAEAPVTTVDREYVVTWFSPAAGESCASDVIAVTANVGYDVVLRSLPTDAPDGVTKLYVYRRVQGSGDEYRYVGKIDAGYDTFTDSVEDGALGGVLNKSLLDCNIGTYDAPTVAAVDPVVEGGEQVTHYYTWAFYQKTTEAYVTEVTEYFGPCIYGWISNVDPSSLPSLATSDSQEVTVTLPRNPDGSYDYNAVYGGGAQAVILAGDGDPAFDATNQSDWDILILRSTTWTPTNGDVMGFEVVAVVTPKLAADSSEHTVTIEPRDEGVYHPPLSAYPVQSSWVGTVGVVPAADAEGVETSVYRIYTLTYVIDGEETIRSADSAAVQIGEDGDGVTITLPAAPVGATAVNIYRRTLPAPDDPGYEDALAQASQYRLVVTLPPGATDYTDTLLDVALGGPIPPTSLIVEYAGPDVTTASSTAEAVAPPAQIPETRLYVYTYVTEYGEEGPPSPPSELIEVYPGASVTLEAMLGNPNSSQYNITSKRIYRSSTGTNLTTLQFVAEIDAAEPAYTDVLPGSELGEVIQSTYYFQPPETCRGMRLMANGIMVMFDDKTIYPSDPYLPHAYDPNNLLTTENEIVGLGVFGQSLAVLTISYPYVLTGTHPNSLSLTRLPVPQACCSKQSIVSTGDGVLYASPDGLILISDTGVRNLTEMILNRDQWQAYNPYTMHAYVYNNYVFVFHDTGCILFNFSGAAAVMAEIDETAVAGFYDAIQDALFYSKTDGIYKWNAGELVPYTWRSKIFQVIRPHNFGWAQVEADSYPVTFRVYNGMSPDPLYSYSVPSREPFRLPANSVHRDWYVQLEGTATVFQVQIADSQEELQAV